MSPRSERSSGSLPSKPPALMSTPTSSPTPLTVTVTAPPATVPSTRASASRCLGLLELLLHLLGLLHQGVEVEAAALRAAAGSSKGLLGFCVMVSPLWSGSGRVDVRMGDLLDHLGAELALRAGRRRRARSSSASGSSGWASASASPGGRRLAGSRPSAGGRIASAASAAARGLRLRRLVAASSAGGSGGGGVPRAPGRRGARPPAGAGVDDRLDLPVDADDVDRRLAQDLVAAAVDEGVAGADVGEAEGQHVALDGRPPGSSG